MTSLPPLRPHGHKPPGDCSSAAAATASTIMIGLIDHTNPGWPGGFLQINCE